MGMKKGYLFILLLALSNCTKEDASSDIESTRTVYLNFQKSGSGQINQQSGDYEVQESLDLVATPSDGWQFVRWEIGSEFNFNNPLQLSVPSADKTIKAVFEVFVVAEVLPDQYYLTVGNTEGGTASIESGLYDAGTEVTITATPDNGYLFTGWYGDVSNENTITLIINSDITISPQFEFDHTSFLDQKIILDGEGTYEYEFLEKVNDNWEYQITPQNSDAWVYTLYETPENKFSDNSFRVSLNQDSSPIRIEYSDVFYSFDNYDNVYVATSDGITEIPQDAVNAISESLDLLDTYNFDLSNIKFILIRLEDVGFIARALGTETVIYRHNVREQQLIDFGFSGYETSKKTWVHEIFHLIDGRKGGISFTDTWRSELEAAQARVQNGTYNILDEGCGDIGNDYFHYELTNNFEFFAVTMTARVNDCNGQCQNNWDTCVDFINDATLGNSAKLLKLLPNTYDLATEVLNSN